TQTPGDSPYAVTCSTMIQTGAALTLLAGTVVKSNGGLLDVNGTMDVQGNALSPVIMTSINDNSVGGSTGSGTPAPGDWLGITYEPGSHGRLSNVSILYAGGGQTCNVACPGGFTSLRLVGSAPTLHNLTISHPNCLSAALKRS